MPCVPPSLSSGNWSGRQDRADTKIGDRGHRRGELAPGYSLWSSRHASPGRSVSRAPDVRLPDQRVTCRALEASESWAPGDYRALHLSGGLCAPSEASWMMGCTPPRCSPTGGGEVMQSAAQERGA